MSSGPPFPTGAMFAPTPTFARGALPTPAHRLAAAMPHRIVGATPPNYLIVPMLLSMWNNADHGCCVTTEEAFAKACSGIFISDAEALRWASAHGVLEGAYLDQVLDWFTTGGFTQDGNTYNDGNKLSVDYTNVAALQNAIAQGPVKIGVAANQLQATPGVGRKSGWIATGYRADPNLDHCVSLSSYGTMAWLAQALSQALGYTVTLPGGVDGGAPGYVLFTWNTVGIIDHQSMVAMTGEAWLRVPTTKTVGGNPPTPDPVTVLPGPVSPPPPSPPPPSPPPPSPPPAPAPLYTLVFNATIRAGQQFKATAPKTTPKGSTLAVYLPSHSGEVSPLEDVPQAAHGVTLGQVQERQLLAGIDWPAFWAWARTQIAALGTAAEPAIDAEVDRLGIPAYLKPFIKAAVHALIGLMSQPTPPAK